MRLSENAIQREEEKKFGEFFGTCELLQFLGALDRITNECADRAASAVSGIRMMSVLPW